jgi:hypothetical protein
VTLALQSLCVVHLARAANGIEPLAAFLDSYRAHPAGIEHDLVIVFKGFKGDLPGEYESILRDVSHERRFVTDRGVDIDVYFEAARTLKHQALCFVNSFSVILVDGWLRKLYVALASDGVGLVGATGSWQSIYLPYTTPASLAAARARRPAWRRQILRWFPFLRRIRQYFYRRRMRNLFDPFPNGHLRTNAFMLRRETAERVELLPTRRKLDAYLFESGKRGLTQQVLAMSLKVLVVGRGGDTYELSNWHASNTFWRLEQANLLVADNQTRAYAVANRDTRMHLSTLAWGPHADPGPEV